ncbi:MAG: glycosyltransferase family 39 protein [Deltaproteobacteria bacterium]|nr:glycosyltransferase family 39 protein [Deltaproteobacteria bacterium]
MPEPFLSSERRPSDATAAALLVALSTLLHVAYAGFLPLSPQEAYYWQYARHPALSYFDHPPAAAWSIRAFTLLLGDSERTVRLAAASWSAIFCLFFFLAGRRLLGSRGALAATAVMLVTPFFSLGQTIITPDGPLAAGWIAAFYFTVRALQDERPAWLLAAGAAAGVASLGKYTGLLLLPQIFLALLLDRRGRRMLATPHPWIGAALALLVFSPVVIWNATHGWASFGFQFGKRGQDMHFEPVLIGRFFGLQALVVSPLLVLVLLASMATAVRRWREETMRLCALFSVPMMGIWIAVSPFHWVKMNWAVPVYPTALLAAVAIYGARPARWRGLLVATVSLAAISTLYLTLMPIVPALPFPARDDTMAGWKDLAERVGQEQAGGAPLPVVGCFYRTASTLAFNLPGRPETWSSNAFGEPGLAYDFWTDPRTLIGKDVLLVLDDRDAGWCRARTERCSPLVPLAPLEVKRAGNRVTTFRLWRCGYLGPPDAPAR